MTERPGVVNDCRLIKNKGERLLKLLKDSNVRSIQCKGLDGIGRWRIADYAANKAMESHLFDVLIWVDLRRIEPTPRNVQMRIAEILRIQRPATDAYDNFTTDLETTNQIYQNLKSRNFLLVVGSSHKALAEMNLVGLGVPDVHVVVSSKSFSKIVWVGQLSMRMKCDRDLGLASDISSASEIWDLIYEEATLASHSLGNLRLFPPNVVMDCIMYLSFFNQTPGAFLGKEDFLRCCIAEGIINGSGEMETEEVLLEAMDQLLEELEHRSILRTYLYLQSDVMHELSYVLTNIQHKFWINGHPQSMDRDDHGWEAIQKMFLKIAKRTFESINLPPSPKAPNLSTLFLAGSDEKVLLPDTFFEHMKGLKVLLFWSTSIRFLPSSLSSLCNLKLLLLKNCSDIESLPTSLRSLEKLEFLDVRGCESLKSIAEESFDLMGRLRVLDLSSTRIKSLPSSVSNLHNLRKLLLMRCEELTIIPENCFERMLHLQVLNLSFAASLESLPSSLSNLVSLKILDLRGCSSLKTGVGLQSLSSLEVLDLSFCIQLEDIREVSFQHILPKLRDFTIADTPTPERLLFRGNQSIERLKFGNLKNLEVLHVFGCTGLEELDLQSSQGYSLKHLDILPMENFDKINVFSKDERYKVLHWGEDGVGTRIWVSNPDFFVYVIEVAQEIFQSKCFSRFYIRISPFREEQEEERCLTSAMIKIQNSHVQRSRFVYKDIYHSQIQTHLFPHSTVAYSKCLEISRGDRSPKGLEEILAHTELVILFNNSSIRRLSDLCNARRLNHLKECQIGSCQGIETLFSADNPDFDILRSLEVIQASDLPNLISVCSGVYGFESFTFLKQIYLQHCPKLATLFTSDVHLRSLETLEIRYCCKLKNVFLGEVEGREGSLPSLRNLYLLHVPKLKSICNGFLPNLLMLQVHRCPMFRKLPVHVRLGSTSSSPPVVEIRGELEWWKSLEWGNANERNNIGHLANFRPWRQLPTTTKKRY